MISAVVIARNEEKMIRDCLESLKWLDETIVVDNGSTDKTVQIAKSFGCKVISLPFLKFEFAKWRNEGLKAAQGDWILYVDADERVTPGLRDEIQSVLPNAKFNAYQIPRQNYYLGQKVRFGGSWPDYVKRLFKKNNLRKWERELHEDPVFEGEMAVFQNPLIHFTHRDLSSMVDKTKEWSKIEAQLLFEAHHPSVVWWRILRIMLTEFWYRAIKLQGWRDGTVGWIEVIFQVFSRFITYARLWELQVQAKK